MSVEELIPIAKQLSYFDQQRLIDALQISQSPLEPTPRQIEFVKALQAAPEIPMCWPDESYETAAALLKLREQAKEVS